MSWMGARGGRRGFGLAGRLSMVVGSSSSPFIFIHNRSSPGEAPIGGCRPHFTDISRFIDGAAMSIVATPPYPPVKPGI